MTRASLLAGAASPPGFSLAGIDVAGESVIQGTVLRDGSPVGGAHVRLLDTRGEFTAEVPTTSTGQFRFFARPGSWTVRTHAPGSARTSRAWSSAARWPSWSSRSDARSGARAGTRCDDARVSLRDDVVLETVGAEHLDVLARLSQLERHDLSEFRGSLPGPLACRLTP